MQCRSLDTAAPWAYRLVKSDYLSEESLVASLAGCWGMKTDHNRLNFDCCLRYYELPVESTHPNRR